MRDLMKKKSGSETQEERQTELELTGLGNSLCKLQNSKMISWPYTKAIIKVLLLLAYVWHFIFNDFIIFGRIL